MRTFGKVLLGLLAAVGLLTIVIFVSALYAVFRIEGGATTAPIAARAVLNINLDDTYVEGATGRRLAGFSLRSVISLQDALLAIRRAKTDTRILGLKANLSSQSMGLAQIQELRDAVADFRTSGKPTFLYSETIGEGDGQLPGYYLASAFGAIWMQPSGTVGIAGIGTEQFYAKKLLDRLGVKASFLARKEYKSAPETLTNSAMSPASREEMTALVGSWFDQMNAGIARERHMEPDTLKGLIDAGPLLANEALADHLIDHVGYRDEFDTAVKSEFKGALDVGLARYIAAASSATPAAKKRIALVHAVGEIDRAEEQPAINPTGIHAAAMSRAIRRAVDDSKVDAILIRIDSPGGDYVASDTIWREIVRAKEKHKPVIVSMGDTAASGGYFIAMAADHIFADPATVTGSIGVFLGKIVVGDALAKLDVNHERVTFGESAGVFSATTDFSPKDLDHLNHMLDATYADFTSKAAQGRGKSQAEIEQVARGRVWSGADAIKVGLVDELGGFTMAVDYIKTRLGLKPDDTVLIVPFPEPEEPWWALFKSLGDGDLPMSLAGITRGAEEFEHLIMPLMEQLTRTETHGPQLYMAPLTIK